MKDGHVGAGCSKQLTETPAREEDGQGTAEPNITEVVHRNAAVSEPLCKAALGGNGKRRGGAGLNRLVPGDRQQHLFDAAVQPAAGDMNRVNRSRCHHGRL
jgi:hypothetical protein